MALLNFGSINIDHVYRMARLVAAGETVTAGGYARYLGGKGVNQSIASHNAGASVKHFGAVGPDGEWALEKILQAGIATDHLKQSENSTGNAVVYVDDEGENSIVILPGANHDLDEGYVAAALREHANENDWVILQNEINNVSHIAKLAKERGCRVVYSAAPFDSQEVTKILPFIDMLAVNEHELSELETNLGKSVASLELPMVSVTLGKSGAKIVTPQGEVLRPAYDVDVVDTTGAGDVFIGSLTARLSCDDSLEQAMDYAVAASALQVTKEGASAAIPSYQEVRNFMKTAV